jgi:NADH dehydrogenase/NADH:ubiquinone oxidoreductase subunit G
MQRVELYEYKATQSEKEYRNALELARSAQQKALQTRTVAQTKKEQLWKEISSLRSSPGAETTAKEMWKNGGAARLEVASREFRQATSVDKKAHGELAQSMQQVQRASVKKDLSQALYGAEKKRVINGRERIREEEVMDLSIVQRQQGRVRSPTAGGAPSSDGTSSTKPFAERPKEVVRGQELCDEAKDTRASQEGFSPTLQGGGAQLTPQSQQAPTNSPQSSTTKASESTTVSRASSVSVIAANLERGDGKAALRMQCETSSGVPVGMVLRQDGGGGVTVKLSSLSKGMTDQLMLERSALMTKMSTLGIKVNKIEVKTGEEGVDLGSPQSGVRARARRSAEEEDESVIA